MFGVPVAGSDLFGPRRKNISFMNQTAVKIFTALNEKRGLDSSVGIATGYGLDGPGIEFRWRRDF
jgi:hypothetical protein